MRRNCGDSQFAERIAGIVPGRRIRNPCEFSEYSLDELEGLHAAWIIGGGGDGPTGPLTLCRNYRLRQLDTEIAKRKGGHPK